MKQWSTVDIPVQTSPNSGPALHELALEELTPRQSETLLLLLKGMPNKAIARELGISIETVKVYCRAILMKHGVRTRAELFAMILEQLLKPDFPKCRCCAPERVGHI